MRKSDNVDVDWREDCEEDLADVGHNAICTSSIRRVQI